MIVTGFSGWNWVLKDLVAIYYETYSSLLYDWYMWQVHRSIERGIILRPLVHIQLFNAKSAHCSMDVPGIRKTKVNNESGDLMISSHDCDACDKFTEQSNEIPYFDRLFTCNCSVSNWWPALLSLVHGCTSQRWNGLLQSSDIEANIGNK